MDELRLKLAKITVRDVSLHADLLDQLSLEHKHTIARLPIDAGISCAQEDFMCFEYALRLVFSTEYLGIKEFELRTRIHPIGASAEFMVFLLEKQYVTEIKEEDTECGDLIVYFAEGKPTHAGILMESRRVISKWGKGLLLEHQLFEVPAIYGNRCRFFERPELSVCEDAFIEYAETMGREFMTTEN